MTTKYSDASNASEYFVVLSFLRHPNYNRIWRLMYSSNTISCSSWKQEPISKTGEDSRQASLNCATPCFVYQYPPSVFPRNKEWCRCEWQHLRERDRTRLDKTLTAFTVRASLRSDLIPPEHGRARGPIPWTGAFCPRINNECLQEVHEFCMNLVSLFKGNTRCF